MNRLSINSLTSDQLDALVAERDLLAACLADAYDLPVENVLADLREELARRNTAPKEPAP